MAQQLNHPLEFSSEKANAMLPLLRRVVLNIAACTRLKTRLERHLQGTQDESESRILVRKILSLKDRIAECQQEILDLGCQLVDSDCRAVGFPGQFEGQPVHFVWCLDEAAVSSFYGANESFADRRPFPAVPTA